MKTYKVYVPYITSKHELEEVKLAIEATGDKIVSYKKINKWEHEFVVEEGGKR